MSKLQELITHRIEEAPSDFPAVPLSFRCSSETVIKAELLSQRLGYTTRSKFLADLVPAAIEDALDQLSDEVLTEFEHEVEERLNELHEEQRSQE